MNLFPGQIDGMVQMPRLGRKAGSKGGGSGALKRFETILAVQGYFDGLLTNSVTGGTNPIWNGKLPYYDLATNTWCGSSANPDLQVSGGDLACGVFIYPAVGGYRLFIGGDGANPELWTGERLAATQPGVYTRISGENLTPATFTVVEIIGDRLIPATTGCAT